MPPDNGLVKASGLVILLSLSNCAVGQELFVSDHTIPRGEAVRTIENQGVGIAWDDIHIHARTPKGGTTTVAMDVSLDLSDVQQRLAGMLNGRKVYDECGDRVNVSNTRIVPAAGGLAMLSSSITGERWTCAKTKVPKTYCKDTWIKTGLPFGGHLKTKGGPACTVKWEMETAKIKLVSQSADVAMELRPVFRGTEIRVDGRVVSARLGGFAGDIVNIFGWNGKVRDLAQGELAKAMDVHPLRLALPEDMRPLNAQVRSVAFTNRGDGKLGARIEAQAQLSLFQLLTLSEKQ